MADLLHPAHWFACALNVPPGLRDRMGWANVCDCDLSRPTEDHFPDCPTILHDPLDCPGDGPEDHDPARSRLDSVDLAAHATRARRSGDSR